MIDAAEVIRSGTGILFVTLDSLRYDVARAALHTGQTPRLAKILPGGKWEERRAPGTFTLPAHMAFFSGFLPKLPQPVQPPRLWECRPPAFKTVDAGTFVFDAPNLLTGLAQHGYRTVCVGGVTYFSRGTPLGSVLPDMFDEDHWRPEFCSPEPDSTRHQVDHVLTVTEQYADRPLFLFVNGSATHVPHGHYTGDSGDSWRFQAPARVRGRTPRPPHRRAHRQEKMADHHVRRPRRRLRRGRLPRPWHRSPDRAERAVRGLAVGVGGYAPEP